MAPKADRNVLPHRKPRRVFTESAKGGISLTVFLALVALLVVLGSAWQPSPTSFAPAQPSMVFRGTEMSLDNAQQVARFHIALPNTFPSSLTCRSVRVDPSWPAGPLVYLIYTSHPMSTNTTSDSVLASGGFFVVEAPEPGTDPGPIIDAQVQQNGATRITINSEPGFYAGNQVHWWAAGVHYNIVSPFSRSEMIAIAVSMGT